MQELNVQPTNPTPYTPAGGTYNTNPVPGAGGLPALSGLTRNINPMAGALQSQGRGDDSVLVHMTPNEVNSLQGLAMAHGGSLTINPNTGLPEAGFLSSILPIVAGIAGSFIGIPPWVTAAAVGGGTTVATGDLQKGLMAGLGAYGGASVTNALRAAPTAAVPTGAAEVTATAPVVPAGAASAALPAPVAEGLAGAPGLSLPGMAPSLGGATVATQVPGMATAALAPGAAITPPAFAPPASKGFLSKFGTAAREGLKPGSLAFKAAPYAAGLGALTTASDALQPKMPKYQKEEDKWKYEGPYRPMARRIRPRVEGEGEISFFEESNPYPGYLTGAGNLPSGFAEGGEAEQKAITPALADYVKMFQTSPGPITASRTYQGGAPSELIRAAAKANVAKPASEVDFGFNKAATAATPSAIVNPFTGDYSSYINDLLASYGYGTGAINIGTGAGAGSAGAGGGGRDAPPPNIMQAENPRNTSILDSIPSYGLPSFDTSSTYTPSSNYTPPMEDYGSIGFNPPMGNTSSNYTPPMEDYGSIGFNPPMDNAASTYTLPRYDTASTYTPPMEDYGSIGFNPPMDNTPPAYIPPAYTPPAYTPPAYTPPAYTPPAYTPPSNDMLPSIFTPTYDYTNIPAADYTALNDYIAETTPSYGGGPRDRTERTFEFAKGGVHMDDGAFVVDARTVSELGNGSSSAGQELLARLGGRPVKGPGDGVSDSIPANIGGTQEARVARDEVIFPAKAVRKLGGAKKLYALMDKAHKARKKAKRGSDTKLRKGLGAL